MKTIQMVDLKGQYEKIKPEIDSAIQSVIDQTSFIKGSAVQEFENNLANYLGVKHVVSCGNGTDALQLALMSLNLKQGDEVITTDFTFAATVEVISLLGLKPVLIDVDPEDFNMSIEALKRAINSKTKAIIPVHLFGQAAQMEEILNIANHHKIPVVEDTAQALGADLILSDGSRHKAGTIGDIGTTSFFPSKNLGAYGDGGAIFTNNDELARKLRALANHGMYKRYTYTEIGINSRLDTIQAALLDVKLKSLDHYAEARRTAADYYSKELSELSQLECPVIRNTHSFAHVFHQYVLKVHDGLRNELQTYLKTVGIPSAIYYPSPLSTQEAYKDLISNNTHTPVTSDLCNSVIALPMHTELDSEQLEYITKHIKHFFKTKA